MRPVKEWIAKHDGQTVPPRVRQRIYDKYGGKCHISGRDILPGDAWEVEHIKPLFLLGEHRESNLAPALCEPHKRKSAVERGVKAKIDRVAQKHSGARQRPKQQIKSRGFEKADKVRKVTRKVVDKRPMFQ